jgi:hypothetical protein
MVSGVDFVLNDDRDLAIYDQPHVNVLLLPFNLDRPILRRGPDFAGFEEPVQKSRRGSV